MVDVSFIRRQGDSGWRLMMLSLLHAICGFIAYLLYYFGATFKTLIDISVLPIDNPLGAGLIGFIGGLSLIVLLIGLPFAADHLPTGKGT